MSNLLYITADYLRATSFAWIGRARAWLRAAQNVRAALSPTDGAITSSSLTAGTISAARLTATLHVGAPSHMLTALRIALALIEEAPTAVSLVREIVDRASATPDPHAAVTAGVTAVAQTVAQIAPTSKVAGVLATIAAATTAVDAAVTGTAAATPAAA